MKLKWVVVGIVFVIVGFSSPAFGQEIPYDSLWNRVVDLELKELPKSAHTLVDSICLLAKEENNSIQRIKALIYQSKFLLALEEDAQLQVIKNFKEEITSLQGVYVNILNSMLAETYWQYLQENRWKLSNRSQTEGNVNPDDFRTWDIYNLTQEIKKNYLLSLEGKAALQRTPEADFDLLLTATDTLQVSETFRPTLFDFLSHRALDFFKETDNYSLKPITTINLNDVRYLKDPFLMPEVPLDSTDKVSTTLQIYGDILLLHQEGPDPSAYVVAKLERMEYIYSFFTMQGKEKAYEEQLLELINTYGDHQISAFVQFKLAEHYNSLGDTYTPSAHVNYQFEKAKVVQVCEQAVEAFPGSIGAAYCQYLIAQIKSPQLVLKLEKFIPIAQNAKILVTFRNLDSLRFSAYSVSQTQRDSLERLYNTADKKRFIQQLTLKNSWMANLRNDDDYLEHQQEVILPSMEQGMYLLVADNPMENGHIGFTTFTVTNLALLVQSIEYQDQFQVVNRITGEPIPNAALRIKRVHTKQTEHRITSDKDGFVYQKGELGGYEVEVKFGDDEALFGDIYLYSRRFNPDNQEEVNVSAHLFTDRSIYRPGQHVYFKGILVKKRRVKTELVIDEPVLVTLKDPNGNAVQTLELLTNEHGSFSGEFVLPVSTITGNFTISIEEGEHRESIFYDKIMTDFNWSATSISVEEYKRPLFEAKLHPNMGVYQVNDSVTVTGESIAYAGNAISQAKVVYRVFRTTQLPPWYFWRNTGRYFPRWQEAEIAYGETETDSEGKFQLVFQAKPDGLVDRENLPVFEYSVTVDITDLNGETRSATSLVRIGYHSLLATAEIPKSISKSDNSATISLTTTNLNQEFTPAKGTLTLYKLQAPDRVLRERPWNSPDYTTWSKEEFEQLFPYEAYGEESQPSQWEKGEIVWQKQFDTALDRKFALANFSGWKNGHYVLELETMDANGQKVFDKQQVELYDFKSKTVSDNQLFEIKADKPSYQTGDMARIKIGSAAKGIYVTLQVEKNRKIVETRIIHLNANVEEVSFPIGDQDLGGFAIHYRFAYANSVEEGSLSISVPHKQNMIEIEKVTFRDKITPGGHEIWSFKLKGNKPEIRTAEILASMYDASLDQFLGHTWRFQPLRKSDYISGLSSNHYTSFQESNIGLYIYTPFHFLFEIPFPELNWFGFNMGQPYYSQRSYLRGATTQRNLTGSLTVVESTSVVEIADEVEVNFDLDFEELLDIPMTEQPPMIAIPEVFEAQARTNFQETAFFFPHLTTDEEGNFSFTFTTPEALTKWKLQLLAHTPELATDYQVLESVTQKELMIIPNMPRFFRQGDKMLLSAKIVNLSQEPLEGAAGLELRDAVTDRILEEVLANEVSTKTFRVDSEGSTVVMWELNIPDDLQSVQLKFVASSGSFSDGEQHIHPVLSNRMLVTETLPIWVNSTEKRLFSIDKLKNINSKTLENHRLTLEVTSNPSWYAIQALPYLMEGSKDNSEQVFAAIFSNALGSHLVNNSPAIKAVFDQWKDSESLVSNLEKNQELKTMILEESPWLRDAESETTQKARIAQLFDLQKLENEIPDAIRKLQQFQLADGGFAWYPGSRFSSKYMTLHIMQGLGQLKKLQVPLNSTDLPALENKALGYLNTELKKEMDQLQKAKNVQLAANPTDPKTQLAAENFIKQNHLNASIIQSLYVHTFFPDKVQNEKLKEATDYYLRQMAEYWTSFGLLEKAMIALTLSRMNVKQEAAKAILTSLLEASTFSEGKGRYWLSNKAGWRWNESPIETHSLLINTFDEIGTEIMTGAEKQQLLDELKIWLIQHKETNRWPTTKSTTAAIYALWNSGTDWSATNFPKIVVGDLQTDPLADAANQPEVGTGYFKQSWPADVITADMADVSLTKDDAGFSLGALFWQYFEDLDQITAAETPLKISKKLFVKTNSERGEVIKPIGDNTIVEVGDMVRVRIEINVDREMDFIHLKDMRASGLEPINVLSSYKYQDGLGYYQSTRDAATHFYFEHMAQGVYIFEYDLRVSHAGYFSNGITTIQSMYAPEFSSHSEGSRLEVK